MLKVGIIGLGAIGQRLIKNFLENDKVEIVAICDQSAVLVEETAKRLNGVATYTQFEQLIVDSNVELVYVGVPPKFHYPIVMEVLKAKKHVLCEKPLANSLDEAKRMWEAAKSTNVIHAMNFPLNYEAAATKFARLIRENYIGKLRRIQLTMHFPEWPRFWQKNNWVGGREQGGFVLEVGVHFIQQTLKIFGEMKNIHSQLELPTDLTKCETGIIATGELLDGTPVLIEGLSEIPGKEYIGYTVYGTDGVLTLENWGRLRGGKIGEELQDIDVNDQEHNHLIDELVKAIKGEKAELYDFEIGYQSQQILEQLRNK